MKIQPNAKTFRHFSWRLSACAIGALAVIAACGGGGGNAGDINTNPTATATPNKTATSTPQPTTTQLPTAANTPLPTPTWWPTPTPMPTPSKTVTPTSTQTPSNTPTPSKTATATYTAAPTATNIPTSTSTAMSEAVIDRLDTYFGTNSDPVVTRILASNDYIYAWTEATKIIKDETLLPQKIIKIHAITQEKIPSCVNGGVFLSGTPPFYSCDSGNHAKSDHLATIDEKGDLYYAENYSSPFSNYYIHNVGFSKVDRTAYAPSGVSYIAGAGAENGPNIRSEDGGRQVSKFKEVSAISSNTYQNKFYIIDRGLLRRMDTTNNYVTTVAGQFNVFGKTDGIGKDARLSGDEKRMFLDENGLLFIVTDNASIRQFNPNTQEVSTFIQRIGLSDSEGNQVSVILDITGDKKGNIYILNATRKIGYPAPLDWNLADWDSTKFRIRKINIATKSITTIAGEDNLPADFYQDPRGLCNSNSSDPTCKLLPTFTPGTSNRFMTSANFLVYINNSLYYDQKGSGAFPYAPQKIVKIHPLP